jgi:hypothetical protein
MRRDTVSLFHPAAVGVVQIAAATNYDTKGFGSFVEFKAPGAA